MDQEMNSLYGNFRDLEAFLIRVPESRIFGAADGFTVQFSVPSDSSDSDCANSYFPCSCHMNLPQPSQEEEDDGRNQRRPSALGPNSRLRASQDYLDARSRLRVCTRPECLLLHTIAYKLKSHLFVTAENPLMTNVASNPTAFSSSIGAAGMHSDVTVDVMVKLKEMWREDGDVDW